MRRGREYMLPRVPIAAFVLRLAAWLYRAGLLNLAGIEAVLRLSQRLRRFGRRLLLG